MRLVLVESPYAGDVETNLRYLRACLRDCLLRGEAPFASHALYTQAGVLDDAKPDDRRLGINAGLAWGAKADATVVYIDRGISDGMDLGVRDAQFAGRPVEYRKLGGEWPNELPQEAPSPGERVVGVDGPRPRGKDLAAAAHRREEEDRAIAPSGQRGSVEGGPPTSTAAAKKGPPAGDGAA